MADGKPDRPSVSQPGHLPTTVCSVIDLQPGLDLTTAQAERILEAWLSGPVVCSKIVPLRGGLVNSVFRLEFDRPPHRAVIKIHGSEGDSFRSEARSLEYLASETACLAPTVYLQDSSARLVPYAFLVMELVPGVCLESLDLDPNERADIDAQLADVLAGLHDHRSESWGGLDIDDPSVTWPELFAGRLIEVRSHPAVGERLSSEVLAQIDRAIDLARPALGDCGRPTLIHGDVWDGNLMVRKEDGRWRLNDLLDPDVQFADVEFELAYLEVFDHPRPAFFDVYAAHHSLRPGFERRRLFYWLHIALVHVALFGDEFFRRYTARIAEDIGAS